MSPLAAEYTSRGVCPGYIYHQVGTICLLALVWPGRYIDTVVPLDNPSHPTMYLDKFMQTK
jgi:hypothetical protein